MPSDDARHAAALAAQAARGIPPATCAVPVQLQAHETGHRVAHWCTVHRFEGVQLALGRPGRHAAAAQWRPVDSGRLTITNARLALEGPDGRRADFWYAARPQVWSEFDGFCFGYADGTRLKFVTELPLTDHALVHHLIAGISSPPR